MGSQGAGLGHPPFHVEFRVFRGKSYADRGNLIECWGPVSGGTVILDCGRLVSISSDLC